MGVAAVQAVQARVTAKTDRCAIGFQHQRKAPPGIVHLGGDHQVAIGGAKHPVQSRSGHVMASLLRHHGTARQGVALHRVLVHGEQGVVQRHVDMLATTAAHSAQ
ncbi:hypothetical protein D3C72_1218450 [compost metagenome]